MRFQTHLDFRYDIIKFDVSEDAPCQVHETSMYALSTVTHSTVHIPSGELT